MRKLHYKSLKFHSIFSLFLTITFLITAFIARDIYLMIIMLFTIVYVAGNGIIHTKKNKLNHDSLLEYVLVASIALVVLLSAIK